MLFAVLASGCTTSNNILPTPIALSVSPTIAFPTKTITPTPTPIDTATPVPTPTLTLVPTLSVEIARQKWFDLLTDNGGCKLPCFWGITPGKSDYRAARDILMPFSGIAEKELTRFEPINSVLGGWIQLRDAEGELHFNTDIDYLYGEDNIVSRIWFRTLEEKVVADPRDPSGESWLSKTPIFDLPTFGERVEYYSLSHVLSEQGVPSSVMIMLTGFPNFSRQMNIALLYPEQGIWVNYIIPSHERNGTEKGCPLGAHIEIELFPPGNPDTFFSLLETTDWHYTKGGYFPVENVTSMTVEKFYQVFSKSADKCIEVPTKLWHPPER